MTRGGPAERERAGWLTRVAAEDPSAADYAAAETEKLRPPGDAQLPLGAELYWDAFWRLSSSRARSDFAVHEIAFAAIDGFAKRYAITGEAFEDFDAAIRAADTAFVRIVTEKLKKQMGKGG